MIPIKDKTWLEFKCMMTLPLHQKDSSALTLEHGFIISFLLLHKLKIDWF